MDADISSVEISYHKKKQIRFLFDLLIKTRKYDSLPVDKTTYLASWLFKCPAQIHNRVFFVQWQMYRQEKLIYKFRRKIKWEHGRCREIYQDLTRVDGDTSTLDLIRLEVEYDLNGNLVLNLGTTLWRKKKKTFAENVEKSLDGVCFEYLSKWRHLVVDTEVHWLLNT